MPFADEYSAKSLRVQLEFNVAYTGTITAEQISYGHGKPAGFNQATLHQPYSA